MNTIALVIPYFGKFNNYFHLWMESAKRNVTVEFHIYIQTHCCPLKVVDVVKS